MSSVADSHPSAALPPEALAAQLVMQLATGHIMSSALRCVLVYGIPDRLANGPRAVADLAREAEVNEDALYRVLRALSSVGLFTELPDRAFELTLPSRMLVNGPGSLFGIARWISDPVVINSHAALEHSVKTGKPAFPHVHGMEVFDFFAANPAVSAIFNEGMTSFSAAVVQAVLGAYDFNGIDTLVDVAGGHGMLLTSILQKYPGMKGVLFDLQHVVDGAVSKIEGQGLAGRCRAEGGDFFTAVPAADAYIMKHIIHDWDDDRAVAILQTIARNMTDRVNGRVLLVESVIPAGPTPDLGKVIDLEMLVSPGGRERTADEFAALFARAGFRLTQIVPTGSPLSVLEARLA